MSPGPWHSERHLGKMVMEPGRCAACLMPSFDWSVCREKGCAALKVRAELEEAGSELDDRPDP